MKSVYYLLVFCNFVFAHPQDLIQKVKERPSENKESLDQSFSEITKGLVNEKFSVRNEAVKKINEILSHCDEGVIDFHEKITSFCLNHTSAEVRRLFKSRINSTALNIVQILSYYRNTKDLSEEQMYINKKAVFQLLTDIMVTEDVVSKACIDKIFDFPISFRAALLENFKKFILTLNEQYFSDKLNCPSIGFWKIGPSNLFKIIPRFEKITNIHAMFGRCGNQIPKEFYDDLATLIEENGEQKGDILFVFQPLLKKFFIEEMIPKRKDLIKKLLNDPNIQIKSNIVSVLTEVSPAVTIKHFEEEVIKILQDSKNGNIRDSLAMVLRFAYFFKKENGDLPYSDRFKKILLGLIEDPSDDVRSAVIMNLPNLVDSEKEQLELLKKILNKGTSLGDKAAITSVLGDIKDYNHDFWSIFEELTEKFDKYDYPLLIRALPITEKYPDKVSKRMEKYLLEFDVNSRHSDYSEENIHLLLMKLLYQKNTPSKELEGWIRKYVKTPVIQATMNREVKIVAATLISKWDKPLWDSLIRPINEFTGIGFIVQEPYLKNPEGFVARKIVEKVNKDTLSDFSSMMNQVLAMGSISDLAFEIILNLPREYRNQWIKKVENISEKSLHEPTKKRAKDVLFRIKFLEDGQS